MTRAELFIGGDWVRPADTAPVLDKFTGKEIGQYAVADKGQTEKAVAAARAAFDRGAPHPYKRYEILMEAAAAMKARSSEIADMILAETGFTRSDAEGDVARAYQTITQSAEEAKRIAGEMIPIQGAPGQREDRLAFTLRMPIGVVCAITPFNSPLNTVMHKVAPAIAAGNAVVLKPATYTPLTAEIMCGLLADSGLPDGMLNLVSGGGATVGQSLLDNQDIDYYTFTGSTEVGRQIQVSAGLRRTQLELGNISSTIICGDADLDAAVAKCVNAGFRKAGQVCTSVQRILIDRSVMEAFSEKLIRATAKLKVGNPHEADTVVGPLIDIREAERAEAWIDEAVSAGATLLAGGGRDGPVLSPTILGDVTPDMKVTCEEVFAPIISLCPVNDTDEAINIANDTNFGLAGGMFTSDLSRALGAIRRLRMGNVHINDTSSSRVDLMPYGGVKDSGFGREGPKYAIHDMTEERLITLNAI